MDPDLKERWIAALESGDYHWHKGSLSNDDGTGHCCLGVLCEVLKYKRDGTYYYDHDDFIVYSDGGTDEDTLANMTQDQLGDLVTINDDEPGAETYAPQVEYIKEWL